MTVLLMCLEIFAIGLFTFGGGHAVLPFFIDLASKYDWFTYTEITNMIAVAQSLPGPIYINLSAYVGFHIAGVPGSIAAVISMILPAIVIVSLVANALAKFRENKHVQSGLYGIRPAVTALISIALISVFRISVLNWAQFQDGRNWAILIDPRALAVFVVSLFFVLKFRKHPLFYILGGAVAGIIIAPL